jgi:hypothetical protein
VVLTNAGERKDLHSNRKDKKDQMYPKLIYPKWINGKAQIEFPKSPIMGQIFKFIDQSKEDWAVQTLLLHRIEMAKGTSHTKVESQGHHKQNEADQIMETEEQRKRRLESARIEEMYREEITREMAKIIKRAANKAPLVSDKIPRLPISKTVYSHV